MRIPLPPEQPPPERDEPHPFFVKFLLAFVIISYHQQAPALQLLAGFRKEDQLSFFRVEVGWIIADLDKFVNIITKLFEKFVSVHKLKSFVLPFTCSRVGPQRFSYTPVSICV